MKIISTPEITVTEPAVGQREEVPTETIVAANGPDTASATLQSLMFTLTLALPIARQPLAQISQIKQIMIGPPFSKEIFGDDQVENQAAILEEIVLRVNGSYLGRGMLLALDNGWGLRITHLGTAGEGKSA